jgi:LysM repeat protein
MNNQSPLVPQGSILEQKNRGRARVKIVVFSVLAIHVLGVLAALMMQGCKQEKPAAAEGEQAAATSAPPAFDTNNTPAPATNPTVTTASNVSPTAGPTPPAAPPVAPPPAPPAPPVAPPVAAPQDYVILQGDSFSSLAKKFGVPTRAIMDANPGVEPTRLQIGQKIHVPPPAATVVAPGGVAPGAGMADTTNGEEMYTVKSGDTLSAIARQFGVRVHALRSANNLTTDKIQVGQKLKIPAKGAPPAAAITASNVPTDSGSAPSAPRQ